MRIIIVAAALSFSLLVAVVLHTGRFDAPVVFKTFLDREGRSIGTIDPSHKGLQIWTPVDEIPKPIIEKTIRAEDRFFHWHRGINPFAIVKAAIENVRAGRVVRGGSTITQQLAKLLIQEREGRILPRTFANKLSEAIVAVGFELRHSKRWMLERYLNGVYYGRRAYGVAAAAEIYFGKRLADLTEDEIDALVALPKAPNRNRVADAVRPELVEGRTIDSISRFDKLSANGGVRTVGRHFIEYVASRTGAETQARVETTLDLDLQTKIEAAIRALLEKRVEADPQLTAAAVVIDARTGDVLVMAGSRDYFDEAAGGAVNSAVALRQPGSALKPFTYFAAFARGYGPDSIVPDEPLSFAAAGIEEAEGYAPQNFDRRFHGEMTMRKALANSYNVPAVVTLNDIGLSFYHEILKNFGFTTLTKPPPHYGLAVTLGAGEVTLLELTNAYAALARGGAYIPYRLTRDDPASEPRPVVSDASRYAAEVTSILADPDARLSAFGFNESMAVEGHAVAVKTGTSFNHRDNWAIGYSPSFAAGVWVGHADGSTMDPLQGSTGATGAAPIWHAVMEILLRGKSPEAFPVVVRQGRDAPRVNLPRASDLDPRAPRGWKVAGPVANTTYRIHAYLPYDHQMIRAAAHEEEGADVALDWYLDGRWIASTTNGAHEVWLAPELGKHKLRVESDAGNRQEIAFKVIEGEL